MDILLRQLFNWSQEKPSEPAQAWFEAGKWNFLSVGELALRIEQLTFFLHRQGFGPGDIGAIFAYNSPEWVQMDLALMLSGGASTGLYVNGSKQQLHDILTHARPKVIFVDTWDRLAELVDVNMWEENYSFVKAIVYLRGEPTPVMTASTYSFRDAIARETTGKLGFKEYLEKIDRQQMATLIYTSGTTGIPKGVMLSHANMAFTAECYTSSWVPKPCGRLFSFLPLAHIAEKMVNLGIGIHGRFCVYYCSDPLSIFSQLKEVQPTFLLCVPRLWQKLLETTERKLHRRTRSWQNGFRKAQDISREYHTNRLQGRRPSLWNWLAYQWVEWRYLKDLRKDMGLENLELSVSGASMLSSECLTWYRGIGIILIEAYALSETCGALCSGKNTRETGFTIGVPYPDINLRLAKDGEIEMQGPNVFMGYYRDKEATQEMFDGAWLKTGDLGEWTKDGCLRIKGRKREIIKTAEGKMVAPLRIESFLESLKVVDQAVVIGSERDYLVALITLQELNTDQRVAAQEIVALRVAEWNQQSASFEKIKDFRILAAPFSIERNELTATMKVKRQQIEVNFANEISEMYR